MIPKVINYCWFGHGKKSDLIIKCIDSWKKNCPDYEIKEWNEENFDINMNQYVKEAYENKKWAFVSDVARLWIIYNNGGIYLDTDVELIKSLDCTLNCDLFFATEDNKNINTGLGFGAKSGNETIKKMLDDYQNISFIDKNGNFDETTCVIRNSKVILDELASIKDRSKIYKSKNFVYYSKDYFCPYDRFKKELNITKNTIGIHWYNASWMTTSQKVKSTILITIQKILGKEKYNKIKNKLIKEKKSNE